MAGRLDEKVCDVGNVEDNELRVLLRKAVDVVDDFVDGRAASTLPVKWGVEPGEMASPPGICKD